ncbi:MAG: flagellar motor protein MotB [Roseobacter sp.]
MSGQSNLAPIIVKKKKIIAGGHHGGAWKVAYADFVTAMMAFFMMMWLLNATTEQQRQGLADYFSPTVPLNRVSGGGDGAFGGSSIFSEDTLPTDGLGATTQYATQTDRARGESGTADGAENRETSDDELQALIDELMGRGGESAVMENLLEHVITRITDEGLVIELFALEGVPLFVGTTDEPTQIMTDLIALVGDMAQYVTNKVAIGGHVRSNPVVLADNPVWDISSQRASRSRVMLETVGIEPPRIERVTGHADRELLVDDPMAVRNNRIEIVLLR